LVFSAFL